MKPLRLVTLSITMIYLVNERTGGLVVVTPSDKVVGSRINVFFYSKHLFKDANVAVAVSHVLMTSLKISDAAGLLVLTNFGSYRNNRNLLK